jgi:thioredoxin
MKTLKCIKISLVVLLLLYTSSSVSGEEDDPLDDLEDPLDEDENLFNQQQQQQGQQGFEKEQERQQQQQQQRLQQQQPQGMSYLAKFAWSLIIGGGVLFSLRNYSSSPSRGSRGGKTPNRSPISSDSVQHVSTNTEFNRILSTTRVVLVDYGADWCEPCQQIKPILYRIAEDMSLDATVTFSVVEIDVDKCADKLGNDIKSLPTFRVYVDGVQKSVFEGAQGLTLARRAVRKSIQALKDPKIVSAAAQAKAEPPPPPPPSEVVSGSEDISSSLSSLSSSSNTSNDKLKISNRPNEKFFASDAFSTHNFSKLDKKLVSMIESFISSHRNSTGQKKWYCSQVIKIDPTEFDVHFELVLCCGEMCTKKKFTVPRPRNSEKSTASSSPSQFRSPPPPPSSSSSTTPILTIPREVATYMKHRKINARHCSTSSPEGRAITEFHLPPIRAKERKSTSSSSSKSLTPPGQPIHLHSMEEFTLLVSNHPTSPIIVDFGASWCGPCRSIAPHFAQLATMYGDRAIFCKVDTDESKSLSQAANVTALPTFVFYRNGTETDRLTGANTTALDQKVQAIIAGSSSSFSSSGETKEDTSEVDLSHMMRYESTSQLQKAMKTIRSYNNIFLKAEEKEIPEVIKISLSSTEMESIEHLVRTLEESNMWHASTIKPDEIVTLTKMLSMWPYKYSLPTIDLIRVVILHPDGLNMIENNGKTIPWLMCHHAIPNEAIATIPPSPNSGVALKCLSNIVCMCTSQRRSVHLIHSYIVQVCTMNIKNNDRRTREALTSLMLNTTLNVLTHKEQTPTNMSAWIGIVSLLLHHEGKCKNATAMLVVKRCLSALASIAKHAPNTCQKWLILGNAVTTIKSSDYTINQLKKKLLDTISTLAKRQQIGIQQTQPVPNPWA